ncbi:MAG: hypothetical protein LQ352_005451 [Teloschistes flavicans]|nr:MAG: hypothetical protein LQ352_005451 [Teloschistes flavicans]
MTSANSQESRDPTAPAPAKGPYTAETYTRKADHTPQTTQPESETYILALVTDAPHHQAMTSLRNTHFPPRLNKLSAHIALFRALPGSELPMITNSIEELVSNYRSFPVNASKPFLLSHGVGIEAQAPPARTIFQTLKEQWKGFLSKQDQSFRPYYTIQNKVDDKEIVRKTFEQVQREFGGSTGTIAGLVLYLYDRGFWKMEQIYPFREQEHQQPLSRMDNPRQDEWPALPKAGSSA